PSGTVTCSSAGLTNGASVTWTLTLAIASSYGDGGDLANTASIATHVTADPDTSAASNSSTKHTTVSRSADLVILKSGPATATAGTNISYSIKVTNNGPSDSAAFTFTDLLPAATSFTPSPYTSLFRTPSGTVTCSSAGLTNGASVTWTLT